MSASASLAAAFLVAAFAASPSAFSGEAPAGPVVLTVAGNVANTNRPACRDKLDGIFRYHERAFDRAMLERLGTTAIRIESLGTVAPAVDGRIRAR